MTATPATETEPVTGDGYEWDPTFLHCRREALVALGVWVLALAWTVPYCWINGYPGAPPVGEPAALHVPTVFGIPSWVFYGIFAPWGVCLGVTVWFSLVFVRDDDLGDAPEGEA